MSTPKKRSRPAKKPKAKDYTLGAIPNDAFGDPSAPSPPRGPEAPPLSIDERFEYLITNPDLYTAARAALPVRGPGSVGRPLSYPPFIYVIFLCAISVFGSARSTACHLQRPLWWNAVREAVREAVGPGEADALAPVGPSLSKWNYYLRNYLKKHIPAVRDISRDLWIQQALDMGMMPERKTRGNWIYPDRDQVIHGDATVAAPPSDWTEHTITDTETGEIRHHRVDEDASNTTEGGGRKVYGNKFLSVATRLGNTPHSRVILALESIRHKSRKRDPHREDEGTALVRLVKHILTKAPGTRAVTYDMALRGKHRAPLIAEGIVVFTPNHDGNTPQALQKYEHGPCTQALAHDLYVTEGRICERRITVDGKTLYTPLPEEELERRKGKTSTRFYHRFTIPCPREKHTLRIRADETNEDREIDPSTKRQRFNRTEHLRQVPPATYAGRRIKGFRQDSESQHSRFDQAYPHGRVPAYGANGAFLIYIGYAWLNNSIARAVTSHQAAAT